jgi:outer membrane lipoprotein SlyB
MKSKAALWAAIGITGIAVAGCADYDTHPAGYPAGYSTAPAAPAYAPPPPTYRYGVVERIEVIPHGAGPNVAGTVIGGIVGGLIGHQIGGGSGQTAATIAGAAGGALAGNAIEGRTRAPNETYRVTVRLDDGSYLPVLQDDITNLRPGDRVRVDNGMVYRY